MPRAYRKRRLATLTQRLRRFEIIDGGTAATAVRRGTASTRVSAYRSVRSIGLHIFLMAAVAGRPQLPDQAFELIQALGVAGLLRQLRGTRSALIEICKIRPHSGRGKRIGRRIAIGAWFPLVGSGRKQVRERH